METIHVTESAIQRVQSVRSEKNAGPLRLRVTVEGGGCSGFQYIFSWDDRIGQDDHVFADAIVTDATSLPFLSEATIDYVTSLMGEDFKITNPNATSGCGCGTSFAV